MCTCLCAHFYTSRVVWVRSSVPWHKSVSIWAWASAYTLWLVSVCLGLSQSHTLSRCAIHSKDATPCATVELGSEKQTNQTKRQQDKGACLEWESRPHTHNFIQWKFHVWVDLPSCVSLSRSCIVFNNVNFPFFRSKKTNSFSKGVGNLFTICLLNWQLKKHVKIYIFLLHVLVIICNHFQIF